MKFTTRKEQRKVTETVSAILLSLLPHLKEDEANAVQTAIMILQETEIESEEQESVLDKIKEEIDSLNWWCDGEDYFINRKAVKRILDKYKAESEEVEE